MILLLQAPEIGLQHEEREIKRKSAFSLIWLPSKILYQPNALYISLGSFSLCAYKSNGGNSALNLSEDEVDCS